MTTDNGGTPAVIPAGTGDGGTAAGDAAGTGGRSPSVEDLKALEQKHRENLEKERAARAAAEARIVELERRTFAATAPPADPKMQRIRELQERAPYDENAAALLEQMTETTVQALENRMLSEIISLGITGKMVPAVQQAVRASGYQMSVHDAALRERGTGIDAVEAERQRLAAELEKTKKELEAAKTRVPNTAMSPVMPAVDPNAGTISASTYNAVLEKGGPEARALMDRTRLPKGSPGHLDIQFGA